jgi:hypothetical protein
MKHVRTSFVAVSVAAVAVAGLAIPASPVVAVAAPPPPAATFVTEWAGIALATVYPARSVPDGSLYLGFTSLAVYDAVYTAKRESARPTSARAAAAVAAHDVLVNYFPTAAATLGAELADSLGTIAPSRIKNRGIRVGRAAAAEMVASRVGDGRNDPAVVYPKAPAPGIWRPTPPNNAAMALPWLGHVKPLLLSWPTEIKPDGADPITSSAYAADVAEVAAAGVATGSTRTEDQTTTAKFYNYNANLQVQQALLGLLEDEPMGVLATARLLALVNASVADALITTWRLKLDVGLWRPLTAITLADTDGNAATTPITGWVPLIDTLGGTPAGTPPYPEWPSGHASIINAFTRSLELTYGTSATDLTLYSGVTDSTKQYDDLDDLSDDAFLARIWLGIHFRDAMEDARYVGEQAARIADSRLP